MQAGGAAPPPSASPAATFFYDLGSAESYLVAERILHSLPVLAEWQPVNMPAGDSLDRHEVERRAAAYGLQPVRWPATWPPESRRAMLAATYAKQIGRGVAFSQAAFRQALAGGRDLDADDTLLIAGAACEMHPAALLKGLKLRSVGESLERATAAARAAGVEHVPAVCVGDQIFHGDDALTRAGSTAGSV
jgi:2-hydroxychromene-2-carboxylate isomerase